MPLLDVPYREVTIEGVSDCAAIYYHHKALHATEGPVPGRQQGHQASGDNPDRHAHCAGPRPRLGHGGVLAVPQGESPLCHDVVTMLTCTGL